MSSSNPAVDPEVVAALRDIPGSRNRSLLDEMIELFSEDSATRVASMRAALAERDADGLAELAHSLKGSCSNFGAHELERLCKELQIGSVAGELGRAGELVAAVDRELERVLAALTA